MRLGKSQYPFKYHNHDVKTNSREMAKYNICLTSQTLGYLVMIIPWSLGREYLWLINMVQ